MKLAALSEPTALFFGTFFEEELKQTRGLFTDGSKTAEGPFGEFHSSTTMRTKAAATGHNKSPPYSPWR
jgi:hypothetical protein